MKKFLLLILVLAIATPAGAVMISPAAEGHSADTTNFGGNLSSADNTVQKALDTLDEVAGVGDTTETNQDDAWGAVGGAGTETLITVTYQDATNDVDFVVEDDLNLYSWTNVDATDLKVGSVTQAYDADLTTYAGITPSANVQSLLGAADYAAFKALIDTDDMQTALGLSAGADSFGEFTGTTIADNQTAKQAFQALETAVEAAGAADAFTLKVDAGATAGYLGAAGNDGILRADGTIVTYTDGGDFVTIGLHDHLDDIAGLTLARGDLLYVDASGDIVNLGAGLVGQYLKTGGAAGDPSWDDPAGSGDITAVGDSASGGSFTTDGTGNVLYFEGTTANGFEIALTGANPAGDVTVTIPATTGTLLLADGTGSGLTAVDAVTGDSATAFFDAGTIEHEYGGLEADVSAYSGLVKIDGGSTSAVTVTAAGEAILDDANAAAMLATLGIDSAANLETALSLGAYASNILGAADSDALVTLLGLAAGDIPDISATYETQLVNEAGLYAALSDVSLFLEDLSDDTTPSLGGNLAVGAYEIQSTGNVVIQLGSNDGSNLFEIEDSDGTAIFTVDSDGNMGQVAINNPYYHFDDNDMATEFAIRSTDTTTDRLSIGTTTDAMATNFTELGYFDVNHFHYDGNINLTTGHTFQINDTQIALTNLSDGLSHASGHIQGGADEIDGDLIDIDYAESNYTPATTGVASDVNHLAAHLEGIDDALGALGGGTVLGQTDVGGADVYTAGYLLVGDGSDSYDTKAVGGDATLAADGTLTLAANSVDSDEYTDGSIDAIHLAADVIDETKIADDGIDSEHYNDGSIDFAHLSSGAKFQALAVADLDDSTTPSVLTAEETTNKNISNYKATGADHVFTLPAAHANANLIFVVGDEFQVDIEPPSGTAIYLNGTAAAADEHLVDDDDTLGDRIVCYCANVNGSLAWMCYSDDFAEATP